ncbi:hypothetical protein EJ06DRAFT_557395 [Trichodelitschia bisporula]|uniref:Uncharacterized protein n=1 Tax=Trichodelitschia bisporula TaxID=703511 RepID=A0A6G1HU64_9PEZI|nr:hypothetical protein EJ06DRAFT_557395 [Trichodelitschia bisporula]
MADAVNNIIGEIKGVKRPRSQQTRHVSDWARFSILPTHSGREPAPTRNCASSRFLTSDPRLGRVSPTIAIPISGACQDLRRWTPNMGSGPFRPLEEWCHRPDNTRPALDILRDVIDLKKTNNGLMKPTLTDDLVCDTHAKLYNQMVPTCSATARR